VPGEAIAFYLVFASIDGIKEGQLIAVLAVCAALCAVWALNREGQLEDSVQRPWWLVLIWSLVAFVAWAIGTSPAAQRMLEWPALTCAIILAASALLVPKLDDLIVGRLVGRQAKAENE
jgi:predicted membrane protein